MRQDAVAGTIHSSWPHTSADVLIDTDGLDGVISPPAPPVARGATAVSASPPPAAVPLAAGLAAGRAIAPEGTGGRVSAAPVAAQVLTPALAPHDDHALRPSVVQVGGERQARAAGHVAAYQHVGPPAVTNAPPGHRRPRRAMAVVAVALVGVALVGVALVGVVAGIAVVVTITSAGAGDDHARASAASAASATEPVDDVGEDIASSAAIVAEAAALPEADVGERVGDQLVEQVVARAGDGADAPEAIRFPARFVRGSARPRQVQRQRFRPLVRSLRRCQGTIELVGHACDLGPAEQNLALAQERATLAAGILAERGGLNPAQMVVRSAGSSEPLAGNDTGDGRARNRRVTVRCIEHASEPQ